MDECGSLKTFVRRMTDAFLDHVQPADEEVECLAGDSFAFHAEEIFDDLRALLSLSEQAEEASIEADSDLLLGILMHLPSHLSAMEQLMTNKRIDAFADEWMSRYEHRSAAGEG